MMQMKLPTKVETWMGNCWEIEERIPGEAGSDGQTSDKRIC